MKRRMINCDFVTSGSFKENVGNKAKLLYFLMFVNADDKGFCDNVNEIVEQLQAKAGTESLELLQNDYKSALQELVDSGLVYEFINKHNNRVYLLRHWYYHQKMLNTYTTNYTKYLKQVRVVDNEYVYREKEYKEKGNNNIEINNKENKEEELNPDDFPFPLD